MKKTRKWWLRMTILFITYAIITGLIDFFQEDFNIIQLLISSIVFVVVFMVLDNFLSR